MIALVSLCLLASFSSVDLVDEVYRIPAGEWRYVEVSLRQQSATLYAEMDSHGAPELRAALLTRPDLDRLNRNRPYGVLASTPPGGPQRLSYSIRQPGEYAVVLDNGDGEKPANVRLHVWLDFAGPFRSLGEVLSLRRRLTVILLSFLGFFGIVTWSARRLLQSIRR